jgi:hypothetical protein
MNKSGHVEYPLIVNMIRASAFPELEPVGLVHKLLTELGIPLNISSGGPPQCPEVQRTNLKVFYPPDTGDDVLLGITRALQEVGFESVEIPQSVIEHTICVHRWVDIAEPLHPLTGCHYDNQQLTVDLRIQSGRLQQRLVETRRVCRTHGIDPPRLIFRWRPERK